MKDGKDQSGNKIYRKSNMTKRKTLDAVKALSEGIKGYDNQISVDSSMVPNHAYTGSAGSNVNLLLQSSGASEIYKNQKKTVKSKFYKEANNEGKTKKETSHEIDGDYFSDTMDPIEEQNINKDNKPPQKQSNISDLSMTSREGSIKGGSLKKSKTNI